MPARRGVLSRRPVTSSYRLFQNQKNPVRGRRILSGIALIGLILACAILLDVAKGDGGAIADARAIIALCEHEQYRPACYERAVPALLSEGRTIEYGLLVVRELLELDPAYRYCHTLAHRLAGKEVAKDPSRWTEVALSDPLDICSYGVMHGAFQERFRKEHYPLGTPAPDVARDLGEVCSGEAWSDRTQAEQTNCIHALGHLLLYVTNADLRDAIAICDTLPGLDYDDRRRVCYEGVFMQLYQPVEPEDVSLIESIAPDDAEDRDVLCSVFEGAARATCLKEGWTLERGLFREPSAFHAFCQRIGAGVEEEEDYCVRSLAYVVAARMHFSPEEFAAFCKRVPEWSGRCLAYGAPRFLEIYQGNLEPPFFLCREAEREGSGDLCYSYLSHYSARTFKKGSAEAERVCDAMPMMWQRRCEGHVPQERVFLPLLQSMLR